LIYFKRQQKKCFSDFVSVEGMLQTAADPSRFQELGIPPALLQRAGVLLPRLMDLLPAALTQAQRPELWSCSSAGC